MTLGDYPESVPNHIFPVITPTFYFSFSSLYLTTTLLSSCGCILCI